TPPPERHAPPAGGPPRGGQPVEPHNATPATSSACRTRLPTRIASWKSHVRQRGVNPDEKLSRLKRADELVTAGGRTAGARLLREEEQRDHQPGDDGQH